MKSKNLSDSILKTVKSNGFKYIELPSVIEANHIVQRSGESFRKFIFSFTDQGGNELCLRPDLTIVSCLRYLENNLKGREKIFYNGQAYRKSENKKDSIVRNQVGFEIIGSRNEKDDDKEIINTIYESYIKYKKNKNLLLKDMILIGHENFEFRKINNKNKKRYLIYRYKFNIYPKIKKTSKYPPCVQIEPTSICNYR